MKSASYPEQVSAPVAWGLRAWARLGLAVGAALALGRAVGWGDGGKALGRVPSLCVFHRITGLDCPGCGMTRAFLRLLHGDWRGAWAFNPWSLPLLGFVVLAAALPEAWLQRALRSRAATLLGWLLLVWVVLWWLLTRILPRF